MTFSPIYTGCDGTISITGLTLNPAGSIVTGATVTGTLFDSQGNSVSNWVNLSFTDEGSGTYQVGFTAANIPVTGTYTFTVTAVKSGLHLTANHFMVVQDLEV
jgi:hypothetical protein